jgi:very-short-patch-repair endonuclease
MPVSEPLSHWERGRGEGIRRQKIMPKYTHTHNLQAPAKTKSFAKTLRKRQTAAEERMWKILRNRNFEGFKFRRQHPLNKYIADFYCHKLKLVIELDGNVHELESVKIKDEIREEAIKAFGIEIIRFENDDIFNNSWIIDKKIFAFINKT